MKSEDMRFDEAFEAIMRYFKDEEKYPLSPILMERLKRWKSAREYILTMRPLTDSSIVEFLVTVHAVNEPQAWRDVRDTKRFFASMEQTNQDFERIMLVAQIKDLRTKAMHHGDFGVVGRCDTNLAKLGVGKEADATQTGIKHIELVVGFNPKLVGAKPNPNLLKQVEKYIGDAAKRELMMDDDELDD